MQKEAACALGVLADKSQQSQDAVVAAGAVPLLIILLGSEQPDLQDAAAGALEKLGCSSQHNQDAITATHGVHLPLVFLRLTSQLCPLRFWWLRTCSVCLRYAACLCELQGGVVVAMHVGFPCMFLFSLISCTQCITCLQSFCTCRQRLPITLQPLETICTCMGCL